MSRSRTAPENSRRQQSTDDPSGKSSRAFKTDPNSTSRNPEFDDGEGISRLEHVRSPDSYNDIAPHDKEIKPGRHQSDDTSGTEVPSPNDITTTGYNQHDDGEKQHKRFKVPKFLGGKKDESDYDNGKSKKVNEPHFTLWGQFRTVILGSWINVLLVFSPVGIALHFAKVNQTIIFVINFIAIIPLAGTLSFATEEIALRTGEVLGGLLNATFG